MFKTARKAFIILPLVGLVLAVSSPGRAQTTPIHPSSVMGDKDSPGPDGWVQAPVKRNRSSAQIAKAPGEPLASKAPVASSKPMPPGEDPATPVPDPATAQGPGTSPAITK